MKPFDHNKFIGYICEVTPQYVRMQIPSARLLHSFYFNGEIYFGGSVGSFVVIEGQEWFDSVPLQVVVLFVSRFILYR